MISIMSYNHPFVHPSMFPLLPLLSLGALGVGQDPPCSLSVAARASCLWLCRRRWNVRSSSKRRMWTLTTGRSCCDTTMSSSRKIWPGTWGKGRESASRSTTMTPHRRTKVRLQALGSWLGSQDRAVTWCLSAAGRLPGAVLPRFLNFPM